MKFIKITPKSGLHVNNQHQGNYDLAKLCQAVPALKAHLIKTPKGTQSIDFASDQAVKLLNKALLAHHYGVTKWDIPAGYLCPPIPGRADYVHRLAELLAKEGLDKSGQVTALDIGTGANMVYPIVGAVEYDWQFVASDIDPKSIECASGIVASNDSLRDKVTLRLQKESKHIFKHIIAAGERYHVTMCNPPFHKSLAEASKGTERKIANLNANKAKRQGASAQSKAKPSSALNFGGQKAELWCPGGEAAFLKTMAIESRFYAEQVLWFTSLISKKDNVRWLRKCAEKAGAVEARVVEMSQGQKKSRFVAWTFMDAEQRKAWQRSR
ncbi:23S rRNA (adenine(1618)-N(6))-methyltransferase RlmF [Vibrio sp. WXL103]|uniref:23S rRNA (adenine(1618)-N(6))-methyltransferase RlmF n=1 Tax=unclassified Vibrio TaxID=2614977 RepID=UPI003EC94D1E